MSTTKTLKFNHTKDKLSHAMDIDDVQLDDMAMRMSKITSDLDRKDGFKKSHAAEALAQNMSYKELIFFTVGYIQEVIDKKRNIDPNIKMAMVMASVLSKSKK